MTNSIKNIRSESALRASEERFRGLFEDSPIALWEEDFSKIKQHLDKLKAKGISDFRTYFEKHPREVAEFGKLITVINVNKAAVELLHARNKTQILENLNIIFGGSDYSDFANELTSIAEGKTHFEWEGVNHTLDGIPLILNLQWSAAPGYEEDLAKVFISTMDVTARRLAESKLAESERQLSTLMSNLSGMVYRCLNDTNWTMKFVSEGCLELTGYSPEDFISNHIHFNDLILLEDQELVRTQIQRDTQSARPFHLTYRIRTKSGQIKWVWEQGRMIEVGKETFILEGFISDISDRIHAEQSANLIFEVQKQMVQMKDPSSIFKLVGQKISKLIGDAYVGVTILDETNQTMSIIANYGFGELYDKLSQQFNIDLSSIKFYVREFPPEDMTLFRSGRLEKFERGLYQLLNGKIAKSICKLLEKQLHLSNIFAIGFVRNEIHFGSLVVFAKSDISPYVDTIEIIVNQATLFLNRLHSGKALQESEEKFRRVFEQSPIGISLSNSQMRFTSINPMFTNILGYSQDEILNLTFKDITYPEDIAANVKSMKQLSEGEIPFFTVEKRYNHKNGNVIWANLTVTAIRALSGEIVSYLAMVEDITERKLAEEAFQHEQYLMQTLMDNIPDSVYFKDLENRFIRVNQATLVKFGVSSSAEILGRSDADFFDAGNAQEGVTEEQEIIRTGKPIINVEGFEIWLDHRPSTWCSITKMALHDKAGKIIGTFGVIRDITDRKEKEEQIKQLNADLEKRVELRTKELKLRNQELEAFTYSISHDLKAPLRGITGYSQLLLQDHSNQLDEEGKSFLNKLILSSEQLSQLIDDLLAYSRLERRPVNRLNFSISEIINAVIDERKLDLKKNNILLHTELEPETLISSPELFTQILRNYLDNAIKFTSKVAQPEIWIDYKNLGETSLLSMRDNGVGFDMKYDEKLFDVFFRLQRVEDYPGTGIGLSLVKKAAAILGYRVWAESNPNEGATFYLEINKKGGN